jgi:hypothetical protein
MVTYRFLLIRVRIHVDSGRPFWLWSVYLGYTFQWLIIAVGLPFVGARWLQMLVAHLLLVDFNGADVALLFVCVLLPV